MYEQFYGLARPPFAVTPDPGLLYMSPAHREALATIIYGVEARKGFIVCSGEVGTGKTTVIRAFFDQARAEAFKIVYLFTPQVGPLDMARYICRELDLAAPESVFAAVPALQLKLLEIFEAGRTVVLMIDEAQLLPPETIEFLRLLSNFETDTEKLIQIVLVGQSEIDAVLARHDMRQVAQRVALRARLGAFGFDESLSYIAYRLTACGAREVGAVLSPGAARIVAAASGGIPRRINILADNVLIAGFGAGERPVGAARAAATVREFFASSGEELPNLPGEAEFDAVTPEPQADPSQCIEPTLQAPDAEPSTELPVGDASFWDSAALAPAISDMPTNVVRPQFLGRRQGGGHAAGAAFADATVRRHQRFRLRLNGAGFGAAAIGRR